MYRRYQNNVTADFVLLPKHDEVLATAFGSYVVGVLTFLLLL